MFYNYYYYYYYYISVIYCSLRLSMVMFDSAQTCLPVAYFWMCRMCGRFEMPVKYKKQLATFCTKCHIWSETTFAVSIGDHYNVSFISY